MDNRPADPLLYKIILQKIRKRRKYFFATLLMYIPALLIIYKISPTNSAMGTLFGIWAVMLVIFTFMVALCKCPRCGNYFHLQGMTLLVLRKCLHCQLHINNDKTSQE